MPCWMPLASEAVKAVLTRLETRLPPPVLLLLLGIVLWLSRTDGSIPSDFSSDGVGTLGGLLMLCGVMLNLAPKRGFRLLGTTVNPMRPQRSTRLVTGGLYRYSRNPMYLGQVLVLVGWGAFLHNMWVIAAVAFQLAWLTVLQIRPEERALQRCFGDAYQAYCMRVRRWL